MSLTKVSIDLWGTLIKSSPSFSKAKVELAKKHFGGNPEIISQAYAETKKDFNTIIESTGWQPDQNLMFSHLVSKATNGSFRHIFDIEKFINAYQELAMIHHPVIYSDETIEYLEKMSKYFQLILSSNTLLIDGGTLREILQEKIPIAKYFEYLNFSSHTKEAKPSKGMYSNSKFHIGDNLRTDYCGAIVAGSIPYIINSNNKTIKDAYNFLIQNR